MSLPGTRESSAVNGWLYKVCAELCAGVCAGTFFGSMCGECCSRLHAHTICISAHTFESFWVSGQGHHPGGLQPGGGFWHTSCNETARLLSLVARILRYFWSETAHVLSFFGMDFGAPRLWNRPCFKFVEADCVVPLQRNGSCFQFLGWILVHLCSGTAHVLALFEWALRYHRCKTARDLSV